MGFAGRDHTHKQTSPIRKSQIFAVRGNRRTDDGIILRVQGKPPLQDRHFGVDTTGKNPPTARAHYQDGQYSGRDLPVTPRRIRRRFPYVGNGHSAARAADWRDEPIPSPRNSFHIASAFGGIPQRIAETFHSGVQPVVEINKRISRPKPVAISSFRELCVCNPVPAKISARFLVT